MRAHKAYAGISRVHSYWVGPSYCWIRMHTIKTILSMQNELESFTHKFNVPDLHLRLIKPYRSQPEWPFSPYDIYRYNQADKLNYWFGVWVLEIQVSFYSLHVDPVKLYSLMLMYTLVNIFHLKIEVWCLRLLIEMTSHFSFSEL